MYESDWFSEDTITKWEEPNSMEKTWLRYQLFFKEAYNNVKGQTKESMNKIPEKEMQLYLATMEAQAQQ